MSVVSNGTASQNRQAIPLYVEPPDRTHSEVMIVTDGTTYLVGTFRIWLCLLFCGNPGDQSQSDATSLLRVAVVGLSSRTKPRSFTQRREGFLITRMRRKNSHSKSRILGHVPLHQPALSTKWFSGVCSTKAYRATKAIQRDRRLVLGSDHSWKILIFLIYTIRMLH